MVSKKRGPILLVLSIILLVFLSMQVSAVAGCYTFIGNDESLYCNPSTDSAQAQIDCDNFASCDMTQHFTAGNDCSGVSICERITCDVDCASHARGWCAQLGLNDQFRPGEEVQDFELQCNPGCCKVVGSSVSSCNYGPTKYQCDRRAFRAGVQNPVFIEAARTNPSDCQSRICGVTITPTPVSGRIVDVTGNAIPSTDLTINVEGTQTSIGSGITYNDGNFRITGLNPGSHRIRITANGFTPVTIPVNVILNQEAIILEDIVLAPITDLANVNGVVTEAETSTPISNALVRWGSGPQDRITTDANGIFRTALPAGEYNIVISKEGFNPEQRQVTAQRSGQINLNVVLGRPSFQGIKGTTTIDLRGFGDSQVQSAVRIFVDGQFKGLSKEGGQYEIFLEEGEHVVTARFEFVKGYEDGPERIIINKGQVETLNLHLTAPEGECDDPGEEKNVQDFVATPVQGKKEVLLRWVRPCPEVTGYVVRKFVGDTQIGEVIPLPALINSFRNDDDLEWGETYIYRIVTRYNDRNSPDPAPEFTIKMGNEICEGLYDEDVGQWARFCNPEVPKIVVSCNPENEVVPVDDCSLRDVAGEKDYYCARINENLADCKDIGICRTQDSHPFGLYNRPEMCYGTESPQDGNAPNYCYFDSSLKTITNVCESCIQPETLEPINCFDYRSKAACEINNCAVTSCAWINGASMASSELVDYTQLYPDLNVPDVYVTPETGSGYCVEENFEGNKCSLCGSKAEIFENYFCTADVCTNLGRCFSNHPSKGEALSSCDACGEKPTIENNCYLYTTELECTKGNDFSEDNGVLTLSGDVCGWGRCSWEAGTCVKDGDDYRGDDCESFQDRDKQQCKADNIAPVTVIVPDKFHTISEATPNITFTATDSQNPMGSLHYCLNAADAEKCILNKEGITYPGRDARENLVVNLLDSTYLTGKKIKGNSFLLRYYSKDKFFNQEEAKEIFVFVDNVKPDFVINEEIVTTADQTDLTVFLEGISEPASCQFNLRKTLPPGNSTTQTIARDKIDKRIAYTKLNGVRFALDVTCTDDFGNMMMKSKNYTFDLEESIDIIHPPFQGVIAETSIIFRVNTDVGSTCQLFFNDNIVTDFVTDETGKEHRTPVIPGFIEREYAAEHKVVCRELLDENEIFEDYFHFTIDFTPPDTQIILKEGSREIRPTVYGWKEFFVNKADVDFECNFEGFSCDKIMFCLGDGCEFIADEKFQEYTQTVEVKNSSLICYYSSDVGGNAVFQPTCGDIVIDGFGIKLEKPIAHSYNDEVWGVSSEPTFTWQFSTRVPATECRFDFKQNFDYENVPNHKWKTPDANGKYIFDRFPESVFTDYPSRGGVKKVYVKCLDINGVISPEQKMNLEYDPTAPRILDLFADPSPVYEGVTTKLFASTDDKTLCKYADDSDGVISQYDTMEFSFPGEKEKILGEIHEDIFNINFVGSKKTYDLSLQCKNGAGSLSEIEKLSFDVDYSVIGNIVFLYPDGHYFRQRDVNLQVETSKEADCEYKTNGTYLSFQSTDKILHSKKLMNLNEGEYLLPVRCVIGDHVVEGRISFTIDVTAPVINKVNDGNYTCGSDYLHVFVYTNETNVTSYSYEVFDLGVDAKLSKTTSTTVTSITRAGTLSTTSRALTSTVLSGPRVLNGTTDGHSPINISALSLVENHSYVIEVTARDAAGNVGKAVKSDGVTVVGKNFSVCLLDNSAPEIGFNINSETSCRSIDVELECNDVVGCKELKYGRAQTAELCQANISYSGRKLEFTQSGFVCFYVEDNVGNNYTQSRKVTFEDEDGDGIRDGCDNCSDTKPGKIVSIDGCAQGQVPNKDGPGIIVLDTDKDTLPDLWEQNYNSLTCKLDYLEKDSDGDGQSDHLEDYDSDGRSNFEEYLDNTDPCKSDEKRVEEPKVNPPGILPPVTIDESNILAFIFLIIGILFTLGGTGYLIYFYKSMPAPSVSDIPFEIPSTTLPPKPKHESPELRKLSKGKRRRLQKSKAKSRQSIFGSFGKDSEQIPHVGKLLSTKDQSPENLKKVAQTYVEHKDKIEPGLKREEKSIFDKLESVVGVNKTKSKKVTKKKAEDIFSKLKKISKDRKK